MKINIILTAALTGIVLLSTSCDKGGKQLGDFKDATSVDSLSYLIGEVQTAQFWRQAQSDTTLQAKNAREEYLKGLEKGLSLASGQSTAYVMGLMEGMNFSQSQKQALETFGYELKPEMYMAGTQYGLSSDTILNSGKANVDLRMVSMKLQLEKKQKDEAKAVSALAEYAKQQNMQKIDSTMYEKVLSPGQGDVLLSADDIVECTVEMNKADGSKINIPGFPPTLQVGKYSHSPIGKALLRMKAGESASFAVPAVSLFQNNASRFGVKPDEVVVMKITLGKKVEDN